MSRVALTLYSAPVGVLPKVISFAASSVPIEIPNTATGLAADTAVGTLSFSDNNSSVGPYVVALVSGQGDNALFKLQGAAMDGTVTINTLASTVTVQAKTGNVAWASVLNKAALVVTLTDAASISSPPTNLVFAGAIL